MSAQLHEPSVDDLRRESERNRARLTNTVEQLSGRVSDTVTDVKERLSPSHMKQEVKEYVRDSGEQLFHSLQRRAKDNPLQAAAIGAGLAYPLWSIFKAIPAPILLVGAGLLLSRKAGVGRQALDQAVNKTSEFAESVSRRASELTSSVHDAAFGAADRVAGSAAGVNASVASGAQSLREDIADTARDMGSRVAGAGRDAGSRVAGLGRDVADTLQNTASAAAESVNQTVAMAKERAYDVKQKAVEVSDRSIDAVSDFVERNPLVIGGLGLAFGALIAASLPRSDTENRLFGERSDDLKDQARAAASQGVERAKGAAAGVVGDIAAAAEREGFSPDGIKRTVEGLTDSVKSVANRGLDTALGDKPVAASQNSTQPYKR